MNSTPATSIRTTLVAIIAAAVPLLAWQTSRDLILELIDPGAPPAPRTAASAQNPTRWALVIGVSSYKNLPPAAQLRYAHRDAEDYAQFLKGVQGGGFSSSQVRLLTEENATLASIRSSFAEWLELSTGPRDIVYLFLAGHGVIGVGGEAYFVAHDTDPQNLHATGLSFREINEAIARMRAGMVVLVADACHSGSIGWTGNADTISNAHTAFDSIGAKDRLVLKMLASRPSERSYEDARWGGGHGIFTYALLDGLRGAAEREQDGSIRVAELIDYVSKVVPEQTGSRQNPRIAGNFEPRLSLALAPRQRRATPQNTALTLRGPAGAAVYLDNVFRGLIRPSGDLRVEALATGAHRMSVDLAPGQSIEQTVNVGAGQTLDLNALAGVSLMKLRGMAARNQIMGQGGAWDYYRAEKWAIEQRAPAAATMTTALESMGQDCVNDYVQSTAVGLKYALMMRAVDGYEALKSMRPNDRSIEAKQKFCLGRAQIAANQFAEAEKSLRAALAIDKDFACAYNALGVALARQERTAEARAAFDRAAALTPDWFLPQFQIGQSLLNQNKAKQAIPFLEKASSLYPKALLAKWTLMRAYRLSERGQDLERVAKEMIATDPNYAPTYLELGLYFDSRRDYARATLAYDTYALLAPNFADSGQVRGRAGQIRRPGGKASSLF